MENKAQEKKQKIDWKKKGLGWVPDYPDLRDYNPNDDMKRLKVENTTRKFESLVSTLNDLVDRVKSLATNLSDDKAISNNEDVNMHFQRIKTNLNQNIDSVISFKKVKIYKLLRYVKNQETQDTHNNINKVPYECVHSNQIRDLKKHLGILIFKKFLSPPDFLQNSQLTYIDVTDWEKWINWTTSDIYDECAEKLVKEFQQKTNITPNGIVGPETHNTLINCFNHPEKLSQLCDKPNGFSTSKIKLLPVHSLTLSEAYNKIFDILTSKCAEEIWKEQENKPLREILSNFPEKIFKDICSNLPSSKTTNKDDDVNKIKKTLHDFLETSLKPSKYLIKELKNDNFAPDIIEQITSLIVRSISPLAQYKNQNLAEILDEVFKKIHEYIAKNDSSYIANTNQKDTQKKLSEDAILQLIFCLEKEIKHFLNNSNNLDENFSFLHGMLRKYLNFIGLAKQNSTTKYGVDNHNPYSHRQELFELASDQDRSRQNEKETLPTWPTFDLYIPLVSNSFPVDELKENEEKKLYFFLPSVVDLSCWCSPVRDQGSLNSCTAFAAVALLEYFAKRNSHQYTEASPLFLYKVARTKMNATGDVGASIRETMKVLALFGVPPEKSWPYDEDKVDDEPLPYCYAYAQNYKILKYFLLDYPGIPTETLLFQIKAVLAAEFPCIFGFTIYTSAYENSNSEKGHIPYPDRKKDKVVGTHTVVAVGYDDEKLIQCADQKKYSKGAFLIRNSWGSEWGEEGYGWLPYDYVLAGLTSAWWSLLNSEWFDEDNYGPAGKGGNENDCRPGQDCPPPKPK